MAKRVKRVRLHPLKQAPSMIMRAAKAEPKIVKGVRGGWRPGAGRKKGSKQKVDISLDRRIQMAIDKGGPPQEAYELFKRVYQDPSVPSAVRLRAAEKAILHEKPRLATTEVSGPNGGPIEHRITDARESLKRKLKLAQDTLAKK